MGWVVQLVHTFTIFMTASLAKGAGQKKPVFGTIRERHSNFQFKICIILYFSCSAHTGEISYTDFYKFYK